MPATALPDEDDLYTPHGYWIGAGEPTSLVTLNLARCMGPPGCKMCQGYKQSIAETYGEEHVRPDPPKDPVEGEEWNPMTSPLYVWTAMGVARGTEEVSAAFTDERGAILALLGVDPDKYIHPDFDLGGFFARGRGAGKSTVVITAARYWAELVAHWQTGDWSPLTPKKMYPFLEWLAKHMLDEGWR